jgi:hypothetical protein
MRSTARLRVAIAIPARNEAGRIAACVAALLRQLDRVPVEGRVVVLANNCVDGTIDSLAPFTSPGLVIRQVLLPPERAHAGWARRLALDAAFAHLSQAEDVLMSTDADTVVAPDWLERNLHHLDKGYDAVAGWALPLQSEWRKLAPQHRHRLNTLRKYRTLLAYLAAPGEEAWPRHDYEGGASIALRAGVYEAIGGAPTPPLGEDRALFAAIRRAGGRIAHPLDVKAFTSCRLQGRAPGGMADTLEQWRVQDDDTPLHEVPRLEAHLSGPFGDGPALSFAELEAELDRARSLVRTLRRPRPSRLVG